MTTLLNKMKTSREQSFSFGFLNYIILACHSDSHIGMAGIELTAGKDRQPGPLVQLVRARDP